MTAALAVPQAEPSRPLPILIASCDRYADTWEFLFGLLRHYWPDCPFPVYLGTNAVAPTQLGAHSLLVGPDVSWTHGVRGMLDRLVESCRGATHVLLLLDDFFIRQRVNNQKLLSLRDQAYRWDLGCLRLAAGLPLAIPPALELSVAPGIGRIEHGDQFRVTLQASIWKITTLRKLLIPGWTPWEFEAFGSWLSEELEDPFWAVIEPALEYDHAIEKGKWKPAGLQIVKDAGIQVGELCRPVFTLAELEEHFQQAHAVSLTRSYRNDALLAFLKGQRRAGLRHLLSGSASASGSLVDAALACAGLLGIAPTRRMLSMYVRYVLRRRNAYA